MSTSARSGAALILAPFSQAALAALSERLTVTYESWLETRRIHDPEELGQRLADMGAVAVVIESDFAFEEMFEAAPGLRFVGVCRSALNHVDMEAASAHGVVVVNTPGRTSRAVAEHVLGLMLSLARRIPAADRYVREGHWQSPDEPYRLLRGMELGGRTLGLIGLGAIGRELGVIATALGMRVLSYDPYAEGMKGIEMTGLSSLLSRSDFIATLAPLNAETTGMLDSGALSHVRPGSLLIMVSGVAIADTKALLGALHDGHLAGAAADVFDTHPIAPDSPLLGCPNMVFTPHIAGATAETVERHSEMIATDLLRFLDGRVPLNAVNSQVLAAPDG